MAAPENNQFWKLRSKHGRDRLFTDAELLWQAACEYFQWCEDNPLYELDFRGKNVEEVKLPKMRAFTLQGLCRYLNCNSRYLEQFEKNLNKDQEDFSTVITRIREAIYEMKFTGAAAGFLNANIIARDLGLRDSVKNDVAFDSMSDDQLETIINELKKTITDDEQ